MNLMSFDFLYLGMVSLVNALSSRLIHAKVLSWTFIYVTCALHVLDDSGFAYEQPSELSSEQ